MSTKAVRTAIRDYLVAGSIPGLEKVYLDQPWIALGGDWQLSANADGTQSRTWGAIGWTHIDDEREARATLPAVVGSKAVTYKIGLVTLYQYLIPSDPTSTVDADDWVNPLDDLLEGIKARLRADPTMGTGAGGVVFEAAQDSGDLNIVRDLPRRDFGKVWSWQVVEFTATAIVQA